MTKKILSLGCAALLLSLLAPFSVPAEASSPAQTPVTAESIAGIVDQYRQQIPARMQQENVPGLAIVVVDEQGVLWAEGFGYTDWDQRTPVTPDTLFAIQSMSKSFTATAAMFAAQDGLVDLDAPITTYLPDFHINSIFEENPEQKITLRLLLSHTAGLAHEAPVGNNFDRPGRTFEEHITSISSTWLRFPVGTRYTYSNLGVDLAGYILQVRSGKPFTQYVKERVLAPLGMASSTLDVKEVRVTPGRAIGHSAVPFRPPAQFLIIPSGGVWTTANDIARYLRFHINEGALDGSRLLRQDLAETMYTPPDPAARGAQYALGIAVTTRNGARRFQHGGGGFGFNSNFIWYPELKLGAAVLTNAEHENLYWQLNEEVLDSIIAANPAVYGPRAKTIPAVQPVYPPITGGPALLADSALNRLLAERALPLDNAALQRRQSYVGEYVITKWGLPGITAQIEERNGSLIADFLGVTISLTEVQPGLFFTPQGDVFDGRSQVLTGLNLPLVKTHPQSLPFVLAFYAACGLVFLSALLFWPLRGAVRAAARLVRRKKALPTAVEPDPAIPSVEPGAPAPPLGDRRWLAAAAVAAGVAALIGLFCLGMVAIVPGLVYVPWPQPYTDMLWWQYAVLSLPFAGLLLAGASAAAVALAARRRAWGLPLRLYYALAALALVGFNLALII